MTTASVMANYRQTDSKGLRRCCLLLFNNTAALIYHSMLAGCPAVQRASVPGHPPLAAGLFKTLLFHSCPTASLALVCSTLMYLVTHYGCPPKPGGQCCTIQLVLTRLLSSDPFQHSNLSVLKQCTTVNHTGSSSEISVALEPPTLIQKTHDLKAELLNSTFLL